MTLRRALSRGIRGVLWLSLSAVLAAELALLTAVLLFHTDSGQKRIRLLLQRPLNERLAGRIAIGHLSGNLVSTLVAADVRVFDDEGQEVARIGRLSLRYRLTKLLHRQILIEALSAEALSLHVRQQSDGQWNLAHLIRPSAPSPPGAQTSSFGLEVRRARLEGTVDFLAPWGSHPHPKGRFRIDARAHIDRHESQVAIDGLDLTGGPPVPFELSAKGTLSDLSTKPRLDLEHLALDFEAQTLEELVPKLSLQGPLHLFARATGPLARLPIAATLRSTAGTVRANALLETEPPGAVRLEIGTAGFEPHAAISGAPPGRLDLEATAQFRSQQMDVTLGRLTFRSGPTLSDARLSASGRLSRRPRRLEVDLVLSGAHLRLGPVGAGQVELQLHSRNWQGRATGHVTALHMGRIRFHSLAFNAVSHRAQATFGLSAQGAAATLEVAGRGRRRSSPAGESWDFEIGHLAFASGGEALRAREPVRVTVRSGSHLGTSVQLNPFTLAAASGRLRLAGERDAHGEVRFDLVGRHLDLKRIGRLLGTERLPSSALDTTGALEGPPSRLEGRIAATGSLNTPTNGSATIQLKSRLHRQRLIGGLSARAQGWQLSGRFDLPLHFERTSSIDVEVKASAEQIRPLLQRARIRPFGDLDGAVTLFGHVDGTLGRPHVELMAELPTLQWGRLRSGCARVQLSGTGRLFTGGVLLRMGPQDQMGVVEISTRFISPWSYGHPRPHFETLTVAPLQISATVHHLALAALPFAERGRGLLGSGRVDGTLVLEGTLASPAVDAHWKVQHWQPRDRLSLSLDGTLAIEQGSVRAVVEVSDSTPVLSVELSGPYSLDQLRSSPKDVPFDFAAQIHHAPLEGIAGNLEGISGRLNGDVKAAGPLTDLRAHASLSADKLALGRMHFSRFELSADYRRDRLTLETNAAQAGGGTLVGRLSLPLWADGPLAGQLAVERFLIELGGQGLPVRRIGGRLQSELALSGSRSHPALSGSLQLERGLLALPAQSQEYRDVTLRLRFSPGWLLIDRAAVERGGGKLETSGSAHFDGWHPIGVELQTTLQHFPVAEGQVGAWIDARLSTHLAEKHGTLEGEVRVEHGTIRLPKLTGGRDLQPLGPLEDVRFSDVQAKRSETPAASPRLHAHLAGPFHIRSSELQVDLQGSLDIDLGDKQHIVGTVESQGGWIDLFGRRYQIDHARFAFSGKETNPDLDIRLLRDLPDTRIVIEVHGTAQRPDLRLSSDPPLYDQTQVIGLIVSGDPGNARVSSNSLGQRVAGVLSSVIVDKLKNQIFPQLPIDVIKVDVAGEDALGVSRTRLEVGKYLTERLYVSYVHQFGAQTAAAPGAPSSVQRWNANEANVEYHLGRRLWINLIYGDAGVGRLEVFWKRQY